MPTPREWVRICELEKAAIEHQSVEKWIEIDQRKEEWLKESSKRLNEALANLSAADLDIWSLLESGEGSTSRAKSGPSQDDE